MPTYTGRRSRVTVSSSQAEPHTEEKLLKRGGIKLECLRDDKDEDKKVQMKVGEENRVKKSLGEKARIFF